MNWVFKKRIIALLLSVIMVIGVMPMNSAKVIAATEGSQESIFYIRNNYLNNEYLYDDNGTLRFGQPISGTDTRYQWAVEELDGNKAIKNIGTQQYINVNGCEIVWNGTVKVSAFAEGNSDFLWSFDTSSTTFISSVSNMGANLSIATSESFPDRTEVECRNDGAATWGTSKWDFIKLEDFSEPSIQSKYYIKNNYKQGAYLYDDNGTLRFGQPMSDTDTRYQWAVEEAGGNKAIKNIGTQQYINVSGCEIAWNGTVKVSTFVEEDNDFLWSFDTLNTTFIGSVSNTGANLSIATSESFPDRTEVECRNDGAATWGTSSWDFVKVEDFVEPETEIYVNIQNSYYQLYMMEENGIVIYGNTKRSNEYAQWLLMEGTNNLYAIKNKATGHYILPISGSDKLQCIDSEDPYYWTKEVGMNGIVFGDSLANSGIEEGETYIKCIHMENKKGYSENSHIQKNWGTPQWILKEYSEVDYKFIKAGDSDLYMYEDTDNNIKLGTLNQEDSSYYWAIDSSGDSSYIKNRRTGHNITIEHLYQNGDRSLPLVGMTGEPGWSSIKWKTTKVEGGPDTYTIESGWDWYTNCIIHHKVPSDGSIYCNDTGATKENANAWWIFETAPELITRIEIPTGYIRLISSSSNNSLYEIQKSHALVYGNNPEDDLRTHWLIDESPEDGYYRIKNRVSGRFISSDNNLTYLQCLGFGELADGALWEIAFADGTQNIVFRNKLNPLTYLNIGAGAGYAQSTLVSTEAGTTAWVMEEAPVQGNNPEGEEKDEIATGMIVDTNKYYVQYDNNYISAKEGAVIEESIPNDNAVWLVEYYNGQTRIINKNTGEYLYGNENILELLICDTPEEKKQVQWEKSERNGIITFTSDALSIQLIKIPDTAVYEAAEAFIRRNETVFTIFSNDTYTKTITISYNSNGTSTYQVKVNGILKGEVNFRNTKGTMKSKTFEVLLNKGINTIAFTPKSGNVTLDKLQLEDIHTNYRGASSTFIGYEAEQNETNGEILEDDREYRQFMSEASGRRGVKLSNTGDYVEFTLQEAANSLVLRYCIPDAFSGDGINTTLSMYVNSSKEKSLDLTSKYSWVYGSYPWSNTPDDKPHRFFDDSRILLDKVYPAGTKIRLQKDNTDTAAYYIIDFVETELADPAAEQPGNSLSITSYGAIPGDGLDDTDALRRCITQAANAKKEVWIPKGSYDFTQDESIEIIPEGITIRGAGMWHTILQGPGAGFMVKANKVSFYDFSILGAETGRDDAHGRTGIEVSDKAGDLNDLTIQNIWIEHVKAGIWTYYMDKMHIVGCRIRNTYADGINLCGGTSNSVIEQCQIRNTGDDAIALWSSAKYQRYDSNNKIRYNTAGLQWLASSVSIYGGKDNEITDNLIHDTIGFGGGINISGNHNPIGFEGEVNVKRNTLLRCGGHEYNYNQDYGAIWIYPVTDINANISVEDNEILDSTYQGISIIGGSRVKSISLFSNIIDTCGTWGIDIASGISGIMENKNTVFRGNMINTLNNGSDIFDINTSIDNNLVHEIYPVGIITDENDGLNGLINITPEDQNSGNNQHSSTDGEKDSILKPEQPVSISKILAGNMVINNKIGNLTYAVSAEELQKMIGNGKKSNIALIIDKDHLIDIMNEGKVAKVNIEIKVNDGILDNSKVNIASIILPKEVIEAARKNEITIITSIENQKDKIQTSYTFDGELLKQTKRKMNDINLLLHTSSVMSQDSNDIQSLLEQDKRSKDGITLDFSQDTVFPASAKVKIYIKDLAGIKVGSKVYIYRYNSQNKKLDILPTNQAKIDKNGYITINIAAGGKYLLLPRAASSKVTTSLLNQITVNASDKTLDRKSSSSAKSQILIKVPDTIQIVRSMSKSKDKAIVQAIVSHKSSNVKLATVSANGTVTGKKKGRVTISTTVAINGQKRIIKTSFNIK
ncbi:Ig-like protein group 2 [Mobilisporobacter senegalensis]|uniref:Ig-like protein group 2 n=1 Tax=Mobilisporobacter senegalensis TaxID=1329262 RepID=A0A3N1XL21_9FIRM|nr:right-handed parallel beta-helix repeat-containing protein [Mobilisporobacter senegalensis]ROR27414.1 Ig-like protein group 2 [Mobilisporobacter senegalensis]